MPTVIEDWLPYLCILSNPLQPWQHPCLWLTLPWSCPSLVKIKPVILLGKIGFRGVRTSKNSVDVPLSSSASCWCNFWLADSSAVIYSRWGGFWGAIAQLGPLAKREYWAWHKGVLDRLITHLLESLFWAGGWMELDRGCTLGAVFPVLWERFLSFSFHISLLNLFNCLSLALMCLNSLTLLMNLVHFSIIEGVTKNANLDLQLSSLNELSHRMLFIALTLYLSYCLSALCMICLTLLAFIVDLRLTLNETKSLLRHLRVNLWCPPGHAQRTPPSDHVHRTS